MTTADRDRTKHVVYAVVYGVGKPAMGAWTRRDMSHVMYTGKERLGEMLKVSPTVAKELTNSFLGE